MAEGWDDLSPEFIEEWADRQLRMADAMEAKARQAMTAEEREEYEDIAARIRGLHRELTARAARQPEDPSS